MTALPIELLPDRPGVLTFRWRQTVSTPIGARTVEHTSCLPVTVERAVADLIALAKAQAITIEQLRQAAEKKPTKEGARDAAS